jgi:hypothetical protein
MGQRNGDIEDNQPPPSPPGGFLSAWARALSPSRQSDELAGALDRLARRVAERATALPGVALAAVIVALCIAVALLAVAAAGTAFDILTWTGLLSSHNGHATTSQLVAPGALFAWFGGGGGAWWRWRRKRRERQHGSPPSSARSPTDPPSAGP